MEIIESALWAEQAPLWDDQGGVVISRGRIDIIHYKNFIEYFRDPTERRQLVELFREDVGNTMQCLAQALENGNVSEIRIEAHSLKWAVLSAGGVLLSRIAQSIEQTAKVQEANPQLFSRYIGVLEMAWDDTIEALDVLLVEE